MFTITFHSCFSRAFSCNRTKKSLSARRSSSSAAQKGTLFVEKIFIYGKHITRVTQKSMPHNRASAASGNAKGSRLRAQAECRILRRASPPTTRTVIGRFRFLPREERVLTRCNKAGGRRIRNRRFCRFHACGVSFSRRMYQTRRERIRPWNFVLPIRRFERGICDRVNYELFVNRSPCGSN